MGESDLHRFLKYVAAAWLSNQGCFLIAEEVEVSSPSKRFNKHSWSMADRKPVNPIDNKFIVDVVGAEHYVVSREEVEAFRTLDNQPVYQTQINKKWILRGIEAKVSKADFKNGYSCSGCNFNYVIAPYGLVDKNDLSEEVGLITFNKHKFHPFYERAVNHFILEGVRLVKRPVYQDVSDVEALAKMAEIAYRQSKRINVELDELLSAGKGHYSNFWLTKTPEGYIARPIRSNMFKSGRGKTQHEAIRNLLDALDAPVKVE